LAESRLLKDTGAIYLQSFSFESLKALKEELDKVGAKAPSTWLLGCASEIPSQSDIEDFLRFGTALGW